MTSLTFSSEDELEAIPRPEAGLRFAVRTAKRRRRKGSVLPDGDFLEGFGPSGVHRTKTLRRYGWKAEDLL